MTSDSPADAPRSEPPASDASAPAEATPPARPELLGDLDLYLFGVGRHKRLWTVLGANRRTVDGQDGIAFAVWAPRAARVSVIGDFNGWDWRKNPLRPTGDSGVWQGFVPGLPPGTLYKFEVEAADGRVTQRADPFARAAELPPRTASRVDPSGDYAWGDEAWLEARHAKRWTREPVAIYEVHLGSWDRGPDGRHLSYRELAPRLIEHAKQFGFTHLELLPVAEHPYYGSWGYQVSSYYAPTARYGDPDDLRAFIDACHQAGLGVILDWVPAHFPRDEFALARFDGEPLYEYPDPRRGEHPDWGTLVFDFGRPQVRNFLLANAIYWLEAFHVDGLRVDAVASMLYLDYSREPGQWVPNEYGGNHNLQAVEMFRDLSRWVAEEKPGCLLFAEESTSWQGVTHPADRGGLGFHFKWNMGWMNDTLRYMARDPIHRVHHHDELTFAMVYEHSERFVNPLSHDEVVHGKGSLLNKMPGDWWQRLANLRVLLAYQYTRPGKVLLFMGSELALETEWDHERGLPWERADDPDRAAFGRYLQALGALYRSEPALSAGDPDPEGFAWMDCSDRENSVVSYVRRGGDRQVLVVLNLTPVPREDYRIGVPLGGTWDVVLDSDDPNFGGSQVEVPRAVTADATSCHGQPASIVLTLPPLAAVVLRPAEQGATE